jgi:hypothetical protein
MAQINEIETEWTGCFEMATVMGRHLAVVGTTSRDTSP